MCGICGYTGVPNEEVLRRMAGTIVHRGPDDDGFFSNDHVSLGMRRLAIIDVDGGKQPIYNEDKSVCVIFNGEIYNHVELREELLQKGHVFYTDHADTEVLVHLYEEYGSDFVNKLNGMFAVALWDSKKKTLLLVRDRLGVKPLFYSIADGNVVFASEIKAILMHPSIKKEPCFEAISHFLTFKHVPSPMTAFDGIKCLRPGELMEFKEGRASIKRYWRLEFKENKDFLDDEQGVAAGILDLLTDATRIRMRSDVPVGAYLSGGVDSSSVAALMAKVTNAKNIKTFSLGYDDEIPGKSEDVMFAAKVSDMYSTDHYRYTMSAEELKADITGVVRAFDQPFGGVISTFFLTKLISKHVKVALSGDGADELFASYLSHRLAPAMAHYTNNGGKATENAPEMVNFRGNMSFIARLYDESKGDPSIWRYAILPFSGGLKDSMFTDEFKQHLCGVDDTRELIKAYYNDTTSREPLNKMLEMEWNSIFPDQVLAFVDFLSMAHSVEVRSPFLDYRLAELAATVPSELKIKGEVVKHILKRAIDTSNILPEGITKRPKEGFVLPVYRWIDGPLKPWVFSVLNEKSVGRTRIVRYDRVKAILDDHYERNIKKHAEIWNLMVLMVWWDEYFGDKA